LKRSNANVVPNARSIIAHFIPYSSAFPVFHPAFFRKRFLFYSIRFPYNIQPRSIHPPYICIINKHKTHSMKTKSIFFAALLVTVAAMSATAKNEPGNAGMAVVATKGSEVVKVIYRGEAAGRVKITIFNASTEIVFSETRSSVDGFILPLNFSGLQSGEYTIELTDASGTKSEKINYQPINASNIHVSKLNNEGRFLLSVVKDADEDITVRIYDAHNNLVHNSTKKVSGDLAELYSIQEYGGACTFEISDNVTTRVFNF
jgi:hypothetical protein